MIHTISLNTRSRVEFIDITKKVRDIIADSNVISGMCHVYVTHTTAAVMINEHADPDVVEDIAAHLELIVPQHGNYRHTEGNSAAHIKASIIGESKVVLVEYGEPALGTWQGIFFCEFDGPRNRNVMVKIAADK